MRNHPLYRFGLLLGVFGSLFIFLQAQGVDLPQEKGMAMKPLPPDATRGNAALFVGVNEYTKDDGIEPLKFAVNDAVAQAYYFVLQLRFVPGTNAVLLISGRPAPEYAGYLKALQEAGVRTNRALRVDIRRELTRLASVGRTATNLVLCSLSCHGFEDPNTGRAYLMPEDGLLDDLEGQGISLDDVGAKLDTSKAGTRLLLVDACREHVQKGSKGGPEAEGLGTRFYQQWPKVSGRVLLASCSWGQASYEDPELRHGVFTAKLLEALQGQAATRKNPYVTMGMVLNYLEAEVPNWVRNHRPGLAEEKVQAPYFSGSLAAQRMPLGISRIYTEENEALLNRIAAARATLGTVYGKWNKEFAIEQLREVEAGLKEWQGEKLEGLLTRIERRLRSDPPDIEAFLLWWEREPKEPKVAPSPLKRKALAEYLKEAETGNLAALQIVTALYRQNGDWQAADRWMEKRDKSSREFPGDRVQTYRPDFEMQKNLAQQGDPLDQAILGYFYDYGIGTITNYLEAVKWFRKSAEGGNSLGMNSLGVMYKDGRGVEKNEVEAVNWYRKSAEGGNALGMNNLGRMYANGTGVEKSVAEAANWYRKSAEGGNTLGMNNLGFMYANGRGVEKNEVEAVNWYRKSAEAGNSDGMDILGDKYRYGRGVEKNEVEAVKWYLKSAQADNSVGMKDLGDMYSDGRGVAKSELEAVKWYRKSAEAGNANAMNNLGVMHTHGRGVEQNATEAVKWYRRSAEAGNSYGMHNLGIQYANGTGVKKNELEAVKWYRKSADVGNSLGMNQLGLMYEKGRGVEKSDTEAVKWYRQSAETGNPDGMVNLGVMYRDGRGVEKSDVEAVKWYRRAVEKGNALGMIHLGWMLANARGAEKNEVDACAWFSLALEFGDTDAKGRLDELKKILSSQKIKEAEQRKALLKQTIKVE